MRTATPSEPSVHNPEFESVRSRSGRLDPAVAVEAVIYHKGSPDGDLGRESRCLFLAQPLPRPYFRCGPSSKTVKQRDVAQIASSTIAAQGRMHSGLSTFMLLASE